MIRRTLRKASSPIRNALRPPPEVIKYNMFDIYRTQREVKAARKMERIYHKGQEHVWDGKQLLKTLLEKHDGITLAPEKVEPLCRIFAVIFWGEMAAWRISTELATDLVSLEAKMAATSQAHDEARHFYVMHDYLKLLGYEPQRLPKHAARILNSVLQADNLAKKLMGMQLMVEPVALTLFQVVREANLEPVLCDLLAFYERDEARHVALGVQHLPSLIAKMSLIEKIELMLWEIKLFSMEIDALKEIEADIIALGFHPRDVIKIGQTKQLHAARLLAEQAPLWFNVEELIVKMVDFRMEISFPENDQDDFVKKMISAGKKLIFTGKQSREISRELDSLRGQNIFKKYATNSDS